MKDGFEQHPAGLRSPGREGNRPARQSRRRHSWRSPVGRTLGDDGFSIIETIIAIAILAVVALGTTSGATNALFSTMAAREHSVATGLVTQTVSQAEALPFATLQAGVYAPDLAGDANVTSSAGTYHLTLNGAAIAACAPSSVDPPLVPHVTIIVLGVAYQVAAYPTVGNATCGSSPSLVTLVVVASWKAPSGGRVQVVAEAAIAAP